MTQSIEISATKDQIKTIYLNNLENGGLFIETTRLYGLGDSIELKLHIPELNSIIAIKGKIAWHRRPRAWSSSLPSGIGFEFDKEEISKRDFILKWSKGIENDKRTDNNRQIKTVPLKLKVDDTWVSAETKNISSGGMLLVTDHKLEKGNNLPCLIYADENPRPIECNIIVIRVTQSDTGYIAGINFQRTTPLMRRTFSNISNNMITATQSDTTFQPQIKQKQTLIPPPQKNQTSIKRTIPL